MSLALRGKGLLWLPWTRRRTAPARGLLRVSVLVDLEWTPRAGGHVKCWERIAEAAAGHTGSVDLTLHFLGREDRLHALSRNVRYRLHRPAFSSELLHLGNAPAHTDLAPVNLRLLRTLVEEHVVHTTDAFFAGSRTALLCSRLMKQSLLTSLHTDTPAYAGIFTRDFILRRARRRPALRRFLLDRLRLHHRSRARMERRLERFLARCDWVLVSREGDLEVLGPALKGRVSLLRRGIDKEAFHPSRRDRARLEERLGIPAGKFLLLHVGRLDAAKNVDLVASVTLALEARGVCVHLLAVGEGQDRERLRRVMGRHGTFPGALSPSVLPWVYASSDLFIFPSETEVRPNVVLEARACGLPVVISARGRSGRLVAEHGRDGLLVEGNNPEHWAEAVERLRADPARLRAMGQEAHRVSERETPTWREVLEQDLLPVWERLYRESEARRSA